MRPLDVVFEGGGARGLVQNGAVAAIEEAGFAFRRVVGTSAGAITATLVALGYRGADLRRISFERHPDGRSRMTDFLSEPTHINEAALEQSLLASIFTRLEVPGFVGHGLVKAMVRVPGAAHVYSFVEDGGWYAADGFVRWLSEHIVAKTSDPEITFAALHARSGLDLSVVVTDVTSGTERVLNHRTAPDCPVLWGVRMSMSIPLLWPEVIWRPEWGAYQGQDIAGHALVDGGVSSNFALGLLVGDAVACMGPAPEEPAEIVGLWIDLDEDVPNAPPPPASLRAASLPHSRVVGRLERLVDAMMTGSDMVVVEAHRDLVCRLPAKGYGVAEFDMSPERIAALVDAGEARTRSWLAAR